MGRIKIEIILFIHQILLTSMIKKNPKGFEWNSKHNEKKKFGLKKFFFAGQKIIELKFFFEKVSYMGRAALKRLPY